MPAHNHKELQLRLISLGTTYRWARQAYLINGHNARSFSTLIAERHGYEGKGVPSVIFFLKKWPLFLTKPVWCAEINYPNVFE